MMTTNRSIGRGPKIAERVAREIIRDVLERQLQPGQHLVPEATMVAEYGVGRASVREALRILEVHGLITMKTGPGGGPVVGQVDAASFGRMSTLYFQLAGATVGELIRARLSMEPVMAALAAQNLGGEAALELEKALHEADEMPALPNDRYGPVTARFHEVVADMSGNHVLRLFGGGLRELFADRVSRTILQPEHQVEAINDHKRIGKAILSGNSRAAERLMRSHMEQITESFARRYPELSEEIIDWE